MQEHGRRERSYTQAATPQRLVLGHLSWPVLGLAPDVPRSNAHSGVCAREVRRGNVSDPRPGRAPEPDPGAPPNAPFAAALARPGVALALLDATRAGCPIAFASHDLLALTGGTEREVIGAGLDALLASDRDGGELGSWLERTIARGADDRRTFHHRRADGTQLWSETWLVPLPDEDGRVSRYLCVLVDVSERLEAAWTREESMRLVERAKNDWETTVDSLSELVLLVDEQCRVIRANRTLEDWKLGRVRAVQGRHVHDLLHGGCSASGCYVTDLWERLRSGGNARGGIDCNVSDEILGRRLQVSLRTARGRSARDRIGTVAMVFRDVSELYEQQEMNRRRDRFEAMGLLVGGLAHEIGNPLAAMKTTLQVWAHNYDDFEEAAHRRFLKRLEEGVDRLNATVGRILGRDRERGREPGKVTLRPSLQRVQRLFEDQAMQAGVELSVALSQEADRDVLGDAAAIDEVFVNLVKNALEACRPGDRVAVDATTDGDWVIVRVRDTGCGIGRDEMKKMFVPFFTTKPFGTGIGLAHANHLMEEMQGRIRLESSTASGTTATLHFRRGPPEPERDRQA